MALYPYYYTAPQEGVHTPYVYPLYERKIAVMQNYDLQIPAVGPRGVVFYVYSSDVCAQDSKYITETLRYTRRLKAMSPHVGVCVCYEG